MASLRPSFPSSETSGAVPPNRAPPWAPAPDLDIREPAAAALAVLCVCRGAAWCAGTGRWLLLAAWPLLLQPPPVTAVPRPSDTPFEAWLPQPVTTMISPSTAPPAARRPPPATAPGRLILRMRGSMPSEHRHFPDTWYGFCG